MNRLSRALLTLAMLLLLAGLLWRGAYRDRSEKESASASPAGPADSKEVSSDFPTPQSNPEKGKEAKATVPAVEKPTSVIEGFLFSTDAGLAVGEAIVPEAHGNLVIDFDAVEDADRALLLGLIEPPALEDLPRSAKITFNEFLNGADGPSSVPQARLRLRVRPADYSADAKFNRLHVVEIVEQEILGDAWLCAWREMFGLENDLFVIRRKHEPGLEKRNRLLELATKFSEALARARAARAGDAVVRWRVRREASACVHITRILEKFGLRSAIPEAPESWQLWDLAKVAASPGEFRKILLDRWGPEELLLELRYTFPTVAEDDGAIIGWEIRRIDVEKVCAMTQEEFATLQKDLLAWDEAEKNRPEQDRPSDDHLRGIGLAAEPASRGDCERLILEGGARIVSVEAESAAEAAGLRVGDIVWRIRRVAADGSEIESPDRDTVESPTVLEDYLAARGEPHVAMEFFRDGRSLAAIVALRR